MADSFKNSVEKTKILEDLAESVETQYEEIQSKKRKSAIKIQSGMRKILGDYLRKRGFTEISPVILSPVTDPLDSSQSDSHIDYYGHDYKLTQSMIFHKQMSLLSLDKIFIWSPNVRLEKPGKKETGRHLSEFTQLDLEVKGASRSEIMSLGEEMIKTLIQEVQKKYKEELRELDRSLKVPKTPFDRIEFKKAREEYGEDFEIKLSKEKDEPFWLIDFPVEEREFYDKEYPEEKGILKDMDLIYPEGYEEAISGGEREYEYEKIVDRIERADLSPEQFEWYLEMAKKGLPKSAGFGIGIERLTRFICGLERVEEATLFPKTPGKPSL